MPEPKVFQMEFSVQSSDLDEMNHVNNVNYLQWIQDVAKGHWEQEAKQEWLDQYAWVALSHHIEYKKPSFLGDKLKAMTHVHEFSGPKSHRLVRIVNADTEQLIVQSSSWWCMVDKESGRPIRVPDEMANLY